MNWYDNVKIANKDLELAIQKFLRQYGMEELLNKYKIKAKRHTKYPNLILFKYNQIESPMHEKEVQESRGIILDENNNWNVVGYPFNKFFNYNEPNAHGIDWNNSKIFEKLDGSIITLYTHDGNWHVSTSGTPDAEGPVGHPELNMTFKQLFWETFNKLGYKLPDKEDWNKSFIFELTSPHNQVVVQQKTDDLHLLGVRNNSTLKEEFPDEYAKKYNWKIVPSYNFGNLNEVLENVVKLKGEENEGYIVRDNNFNRIKIKGPDYVAKHHLTEQSYDGLLNIVMRGEVEEFSNYFPKFKEPLEKIKIAYEKLISNVNTVWNSIKDIKDRKEFALKATKYPFSGILFSLYLNRYSSPKEFFLSSINEPDEKTRLKSYNSISKLVENYM